MIPSVACFLQNAYSAGYAGGRWPRRAWLRALWASRSGRRLRVLAAAAAGVRLWFGNATPAVGAHPDSRLPADPTHVRRTLGRVRPAAAVALGLSAAAALRAVWGGPLLVLPHPAYRLLTNALYEAAGRILSEGWAGEVELTQGVDGVGRITRRDRVAAK